VAGPRGEYRIVMRQGTPSTGTLRGLEPLAVITAGTRFRAPCNPRTPPRPETDESCGPAAPGEADAYAIVVSGDGFYPSGEGTERAGILRILFQGGGETRVTNVRSPDGSYSRRIVVDGLEDDEYTIRVEQRDVASNRMARTGRVVFTVPCPIDPHIEVVPDQGPPGYTALVEGVGFTPGGIATLTWDDGITAGQPTDVSVDSEGSFSVYLYLMPNEWAGERTLTAGLPGVPDAFPDVSDVYVVVPGTGMPPGADGDQIVSRR
jgi:hypothetical protein